MPEEFDRRRILARRVLHDRLLLRGELDPDVLLGLGHGVLLV